MIHPEPKQSIPSPKVGNVGRGSVAQEATYSWPFTDLTDLTDLNQLFGNRRRWSVSPLGGAPPPVPGKKRVGKVGKVGQMPLFRGFPAEVGR